jgi:hypothetical protein
MYFQFLISWQGLRSRIYKTRLSAFFRYFEKNKSKFTWSPCSLCLRIPPYQILITWPNLYKTWYVYHGTWADLNGVLHKFLPLACAPVYVSLLSFLDNSSVKHYRGNEYRRDDWRIIRRVVFFAVHIVSKESRQLVLPRTLSIIYISSSTDVWNYYYSHLLLVKTYYKNTDCIRVGGIHCFM